MLIGDVFARRCLPAYQRGGINSYREGGGERFLYSPRHIPFSAIQFISLFPISVCVASYVTALSLAPSIESILATLDLNLDMQCPRAPGRDGYMNSI